MVFTGTIASEAELDAMAGENVDVTGWTEANKNLWIAQVEGFLSCIVRYDIVTNWTSLDDVLKTIFSEYAARYCATAGIMYNPAGFTDLIEAEDMVTLHTWRMQVIENVLTNSNIVKSIGVNVGA